MQKPTAIEHNISFKYQRALLVNVDKNIKPYNNILMLTLSANLMSLGFILTDKASKEISTLSDDQIISLHNIAIPMLQQAKGGHVRHKPMYNGFPQEVMDKSHIKLFINAIVHYWSDGTWMPHSPTSYRGFEFENTKFIEIDTINNVEFVDIFDQLVTSNDSISKTDRDNVIWFMDNVVDLPIPTDIPFKENMCVVAGYMMERNMDITPFIKTTTDVLRVATYLSGGDISLATKTTYKSFSKSTRRTLVGLLADVITAEDVNRHRAKWIRLFHMLHVGDYSKRVYEIASLVRNNKNITTFNTKVEAAITDKHIDAAVKLLITRPGDFARRIDHVIRIADRKRGMVVDAFLSVANKVDTRVLVQLLGNLKIRHEQNDYKIVFPKGNVQRAIKVTKSTPKLSVVMINRLKSGITDILQQRFAVLEPLGKMWIDPDLKECPLPTQQRSASDSLITVGRGTKLPIGDDSTLRMFIYWVGQDIDLGATLYDEDFNLLTHVSYTKLKDDKFQICHSGDITQAPHGASEFIDIDIETAIANGARYITMSVLVYSGPTFAEHEECFAGWMTRSAPGSNEIYMEKTVQQKVDLRNESRNAIPVIFDLVERKAIWADIATSKRSRREGNNIESNRASIEETMQALVEMKNKLSLYELYMMHAHGRGTVVPNKEDADVVFSMYEGITPYNITEINSKYLV